jgi:hypothetical protein
MSKITKPEDVEGKGEEEDKDIGGIVDVGSQEEEEVIAPMDDPRDEKN